MAQVEKIKKLIREMMDQEMKNCKDAVSRGTLDEIPSPVVYTMLQVLLTKIEKMPNEPANDDLEKEVYEHLWKGRMGADVSKPIYFSYDELLEVARHFAAWQKQQMIKKAFSVEIGKQRPDYKCVLNGNFFKYDTGDKVKVIIIKEDEK